MVAESAADFSARGIFILVIFGVGKFVVNKTNYLLDVFIADQVLFNAIKCRK
jgi:hypothetical protein